MKKGIICTLALALVLSSCGTSGSVSGNSGAVVGGAILGGSLGSAIGGIMGDNGPGRSGRHTGSAIGAIVGTIAGAAIANEMTSQQSSSQYAQSNAGQNGYQQISTYERYRASDNSSSAVANMKISNIRFIDDNADHVISSGEQAKIVFDLMNEGNETAREVVPIVVETTGMKNIYISESVMIEQIEPGSGIKYTATITATDKIKDGTITIHIGVTDNIGQEYEWTEFTLPTSRY